MISGLDIVGVAGAVLILLAFWLLTRKVVHSHSYEYLALNLAGGVLLAFDTFRHGAYSSSVLNVVWALVALYGLGWAHRRKEAKLKR